MFYYWCTAKITLIGFHIYLLPNDGLTSVYTAISLGEGGGGRNQMLYLTATSEYRGAASKWKECSVRK